MHSRAKPYLLWALPAAPYLVGAGLQMSGLSNLWLSGAAFELAAFILAAVSWSFWAGWHQTAIIAADRQKAIHIIRAWRGIKIPRLVTIRAELLAGFLVFLVCNVGILKFIDLAESQAALLRTESSYAPQLKQFYADLGGLFWTPLSKNMADNAYDEWQKTAEAKEDEIISWVGSHMGQQAQQRLADTHDVLPVGRFSQAISDKHNGVLLGIWVMQGNIKHLIETNVWDHQSQIENPR